MSFFVLMIIFFGVAVASFVFYRKARGMERQQGQGQLPPGYAGQLPGGHGGGFTPVGNQLTGGQSGGERNVLNLQINDIVSHFGTDYIVEGRLDHWEEGWTWVTYMLKDGDKTRWLSAEEDDELEVSLWREIDDLHLSGPRPPEFLEWRGVKFRMVEYGTARINQQGRTGRKTGLSADYWEYEGPNGEMLSVERWGNEYEVSIGEEVNPYALEILPGDAVDF